MTENCVTQAYVKGHTCDRGTGLVTCMLRPAKVMLAIVPVRHQATRPQTACEHFEHPRALAEHTLRGVGGRACTGAATTAVAARGLNSIMRAADILLSP
eukprot:6214635-Pleurochrysis_carterae.AAC.3